MRNNFFKSTDLYTYKELKRSGVSPFVLLLNKLPCGEFISYKLLNKVISLEGGAFHSHTLRMVLEQKRGITLGSYSYGRLQDLFSFPVKTVIGRYVSMGPGVKIFQANHPLDFISTHPFFYNNDIGVCDRELIHRNTLYIGHDVWVGANSIICPGCHQVGHGAVIAAGAVVTKDVPDYAIVGGNPARIIKMRFNEHVIEKLIKSEWWLLPLEKIKSCTHDMTHAIEEDHFDRTLNQISLLKDKENDLS